jgi:hypothetical protein
MPGVVDELYKFPGRTTTSTTKPITFFASYAMSRNAGLVASLPA